MENTENTENKFIEKDLIDFAIQKIKKEQTLTLIFLDKVYYFLTNFIKIVYALVFNSNALTFFCIKKIEIKSVILKYNDLNYIANKTTALLLYDNGIILNKLFIPYENIIEFERINNDLFNITIFAKIKNEKNNCYINLGNEVITINIISNNLSYQINKYIKSNMYYHIKYNKMNSDVVKYYAKKEL